MYRGAILVHPLTISPPFGCKTWPVMYEESSLARNTKQVATSAGSPARPSGTSDPNFSTFFPGNVAGISGVQIGAGATAFTRIFRLTKECANDRVKLTIAPFVAE